MTTGNLITLGLSFLALVICGAGLYKARKYAEEAIRHAAEARRLVNEAYNERNQKGGSK